MTETTLIAAQDIATGRDQLFRAIYVNHARAGATSWELQIVFSTLGEKFGKPTVEEQVTLLMSPMFARALINALHESLKTYESVAAQVPQADK